MSKLFIISNRLPVTLIKKEKEFVFKKSIGGLATGLKSYHEQADSLWVGWPGVTREELDPSDETNITKELKNSYHCVPVFLSDQEINQYYHGFCNNTIWPLFHYFTSKTEYEFDNWEAYKKVNRTFYDSIASEIEEDDIIWIHDYQLMLLPQMIKENFPKVQVGFFLHIPFPSFEIFRLLIWREEILTGLLGADLIGFHTYDYVRHFLSCSNRILGFEHNLNRISCEGRYVHVEAFPMGIDYAYFFNHQSKIGLDIVGKEMFKTQTNVKMILSIDRLDYTKGIPERIKAFSRFLIKYPDYLGKIRLNLIVAPSRVEVPLYIDLRREITELISEVNGKFGTVNWMPIWFYFHSYTQSELIEFYKYSDVLLVTPLRDGMNLVAKEYIASKSDYKGMVVISETAGASSELAEAIIVNANDRNAIAQGIKSALELSEEEITERNKIMHTRLERYDINKWADEFLGSLSRTKEETINTIKKNVESNIKSILTSYENAAKRILFLDYDGTLTGFKPIPEQAKPDDQLISLLTRLSEDPKNTIVIASGRDRKTLSAWFGKLPLNFLASHGLWLCKFPENEWRITLPLESDWKDSVRHLLELYTDRMPGSLIEEKEYSLAWHYRQCEPDMAAAKVSEVREALLCMTQTMSLGIQEGSKVLEIKDSRVNKGSSAAFFLQDNDFDFILGAGDDNTDEDLFNSLPKDAYTIKVGIGNTDATYRTKTWKTMRTLLERFVETDTYVPNHKKTR